MDLSIPSQCLQLLPRLRPGEVDETQPVLLEVLEALERSQASAGEVLQVLERLRPLLLQVQTIAATRYAAHPLPPDSVENATLQKVVQLWQSMAARYAQLSISAESFSPEERALLLQRRIHYAGLALIEYFRAHRAIRPGLWVDLHEAYRAAEVEGLARQRVNDPLNIVWKAQSPAEAYIATLLVDLANPYGRNPQELVWVMRWAQRFAPYCSMQEPEPALDAPAYALDLAQDAGLRPMHTLSPEKGIRRLEGARIAGQIRTVLEQFKQGVTPAALGLGDDCPVEAGGRLLLWLYRPWGQATSGRRFPRRGTQGQAELCLHRDAIVYFINRGPFVPPNAVNVGTRSLASDLQTMTYGERVVDASTDKSLRESARLVGINSELWDVLDQSVNGFRLSGKPRFGRLEHQQLVALRPPDGQEFLLARVSWLLYREDGNMEAGVQVLPGLPKLIAARRPKGGARAAEMFEPCFMLPPVTALDAPASIVVRSGWYQPHQILEIHDGRSGDIRLTGILASGADFEQIAYERLQLKP